MVSLVSRAIGAVALALGIAWVIRPMTMIRLQYRALYFWTEEPDLSHTSDDVARAGGVVLAALGAALLIGLLP